MLEKRTDPKTKEVKIVEVTKNDLFYWQRTLRRAGFTDIGILGLVKTYIDPDTDEFYTEDQARIILTELDIDIKKEGKEIQSYQELVGTQKEAEIPQEWKEEIWKCPSCKYWFTIDWNHDGEVCCACAGCTKHPFIGEFVECHCSRCEDKKEKKC